MSQNDEVKKKWKSYDFLWVILGFFVALFTLCSLGLFMVCSWAPMHWDSILFLTPAVNLANNNGWKFSVYVDAFVKNGYSWDWRFHGFLTQYVLAKMNGPGDPSLFLNSMGVINILSYIFASIYVFIQARIFFGVAKAFCIGSMSGVLVVNGCLYLQGRPEHLIPLIISLCGIFRSVFFNKSHFSVLISYGLEAGLISACSPLPGVYFVLFSLLRLCFFDNVIFFDLLVFSLSTVFTWIFVVELFGPVHFFDIVANTVYLGRNSYGDTPRVLSLFFGIWIFDLYNLFMIAPYLFIFVFWMLYVFFYWPKISLSYFGFCLFGILFFLFTFYGSVARFGVYNLLPLSLSFIVFVFQSSIILKRFYQIAFVFALGFGGFFSLVNRDVQFYDFLKNGVSLGESKCQLNELVGLIGINEKIAISFQSPFVSMDSSDFKFISVKDIRFEYYLNDIEFETGFCVPYIIVSQNSPSVPPDRIGRFVKVFDNWQFVSLKFLWYSSQWPPGYQFALYKRI